MEWYGLDDADRLGMGGFLGSLIEKKTNGRRKKKIKRRNKSEEEEEEEFDTMTTTTMLAIGSNALCPIRFLSNDRSSSMRCCCIRKTTHIIAGMEDGSELFSAGSSKQSLKHVMNKFLSFCEQNKGLRHAAFVVTTVLAAAPALAEEEKGKIFDFNLTLPIIVAEFLLLMVALDNIWFKPVAKVMDERDEAIRSKLLGVRDNSGDIKKLQEEAEALIKAARAETTAALNQMKKETAAALEVKLQESKARIEEELAQALSNLEEQKKETLRSLDQQVQDLSEQILRKVIPADLSR